MKLKPMADNVLLKQHEAQDVRRNCSCTLSGSDEDIPCKYSSSVSSPHGSTNNWWRSLSGKCIILSSKLGQ